MLSKEEVEALVHSRESDRFELTTSISDVDKFGEAICAFSNDLPNHKKPGYLLIGIDEKKRKLSGLRVSDRSLRDISAIRSDGNILPQPAMTVQNYSFEKGDVIVVEVLPAHFPPVRYKGRLWVRIGARRAIANETEERLLIEKRTANVHTFDEYPCSTATLDDLRTDLFQLTYLPKAIDHVTLSDDIRDVKFKLASLRFYDLLYDCPTNAGLLMFGKNVKYYFPAAYVQYVSFKGDSVADEILSEKLFSGNLITIVNELDTFLKSVIIKERPVPVSMLREETWRNFPYWAIREFLMNALMHRSYEINTPIKFYQFADRIEIVNPGGLYGNARPENFPDVSDYRNLIVAEAMKVMGFVNRFNRGVVTAQKQLIENGNKQAIFNLETLGVFGVTIIENILNQNEGLSEGRPATDGGINGGINGGIKKLSKSEQKVLKIVHQCNGAKVEEIEKLSKLSRRTVERILSKLKKNGLIEYVGALKTGGYKIKKSGV